VGTATSTAGLIAATEVSLFAANEIWHDATPDQTLELSSVLTEKLITSDVTQTVATEAIGGLVMDYFCLWYPLSADSTVTAA